VGCPANLVSAFTRPSDNPYRRRNEQYLFKFFIEVAGATVARSNISGWYWLGAFPQVAFATPSVRNCLLAIAAGFYEASGKMLVAKTEPYDETALMTYELRAMRALSQGKPTTAEVLSTSMAFWVTSMVTGNWSGGMKHLYHCLKIITSLEDVSTFDPMQLRYMFALAKISLAYFRTTRGPCPQHGPGDFLACEAECFVDEPHPFAERLYDALYHLNAALPTFRICLDLLENRAEPHSHQDELASMLKKQIWEITFLLNAWGDTDRMPFSKEDERLAKRRVPFTHSPFESVMSDIIRYIVNDTDSPVLFQELELRTRVAIPHVVCSTSRGELPLVVDALVLMFYGGYTDGYLTVKGKWPNKHVETFMAHMPGKRPGP
jgi:hypothetical protein